HQDRLRLGEVTEGLVEVRLVLARIELVEELTCLHGGAVAILLLEQVTLHLGADLRVDITVSGSDPLGGDGDILLADVGDQYLDRGRDRRGSLTAADRG